MIDFGRISVAAHEKKKKSKKLCGNDIFDVAELEEFTMLAYIGRPYCESLLEPKSVDDEIAIFTCYNKSFSLLNDMLITFKYGFDLPEDFC